MNLTDLKIYIPNNPKHLGKCGVTDYTHTLVSLLREKGLSASEPLIGNLSYAPLYLFDSSLLHLQYPSLDYRFSFLPHIYSWISKNCIVTLHETEALHRLRRLTLPLFKPAACIVTNDFDFSNARKIFPRVRIEKIPLAPSFVLDKLDVRDRVGALKVVYFGLIRGGKGLDDVIKFSRLLDRLRPDVEFHVVCGEPRNDQRSEFDKFKSKLSKATVLHIGTPTSELPIVLSSFDMAFLPFPGGADENRSSLLALISLGVVPMTYISDRTPKRLFDSVLHCGDPSEAVNLVPSQRSSLLSHQKKLTQLKPIYNWKFVVEKHLELYTDILKAPLKK